MSKIVFLDMDGVLCTPRAHYAYASGILMRHLDPVACKLLERLCKEQKAEIVLSSTWRVCYDLSSMNTILCNGGFSEVPWHQNWKTPQMRGVVRGEEIKEWLRMHGGSECKYVILDDNSDMLEEQKPFFVQTDDLDGFLLRHYDRAEEILGGKRKRPPAFCE